MAEQLGFFMHEHINKSEQLKFANFRRIFASHTCDSAFSQEGDFRRAFADYINTSQAIMLRNYNRSTGVVTLRRTQETIHSAIIDPVTQSSIDAPRPSRFLEAGSEFVNVMRQIQVPVETASLAPEHDNIDEKSDQGQIQWIDKHPSPYAMFNFKGSQKMEFAMQVLGLVSLEDFAEVSDDEEEQEESD